MKGSHGLLLPFVGFLLCSCNILEENAQYIAPVATEVVFLEVPADSLEQYGIAASSTVTLMVAIGQVTSADLSSSTPFSGGGVAGVEVTLHAPNGSFPVPPDPAQPGFYLLQGADDPALTYQVGENYTVEMKFNGEIYTVTMTAPEKIALVSPEEMSHHAPQADLDVGWSPIADAAALTAFEGTGKVVYDNLPRDLNSLYNFLTAQGDSVEVIPGAVFGDEGVYGIGVTGLFRTPVDSAHFSANLNALVSNAVAGTAAISAVYTSETPPTW